MDRHTQEQRKLKWVKISAVVIFITTLLSIMFLGSFGPGWPVVIFIDIIIAEILPSAFWPLRSSILFILVTTTILYSLLLTIIIDDFQRKEYKRTILLSLILIPLFSLLYLHEKQLALFDWQCDPEKDEPGLIMRECSGGVWFAFNIPFDNYEGSEWVEQQLSEAAIAPEDLEELRENGGNFGYFCSFASGCSVDNNRCVYGSQEKKEAAKTGILTGPLASCADCIRECKDSVKSSHVLDLLKSQEFINCWGQCKQEYTKNIPQ